MKKFIVTLTIVLFSISSVFAQFYIDTGLILGAPFDEYGEAPVIGGDVKIGHKAKGFDNLYWIGQIGISSYWVYYYEYNAWNSYEDEYSATLVNVAGGILFYPSEKLQLAATLGTALNFEIGFDFGGNKQNGLLLGLGTSLNFIEESGYAGLFLKYRYKGSISSSQSSDRPVAPPQRTIAQTTTETPSQPSRTSTTTAVIPGIPGALGRVTENAMRRVPTDSRVAIVNVSVADRSQREFIAGELEIMLFNLNYRIIDRSELDRIREELHLQYSGEVDDEDAVALGRLSGADYIITCRIDGERDLRRLRLRVLETQTAQVVGVAAEPF